MSVSRRTELTVQAASDPASLSRVIGVASSCGADVLAARSYWNGYGTVVMLVTEDEMRTARALAAAGFKCQSNPVVLIQGPTKPGLAALLGTKLKAAGIDVVYSYSFGSDGNQTCTVFRTSNDERAAYLLELDGLIHELAAAKSWRRRAVTPRVALGPVTQAA